MSNEVNNFVITKGSDNHFVFTIKENGTTTPMLIKTDAPADTFAFRLIKLSDDSDITSSLTTSTLTVKAAAAGQIELKIPTADTGVLESNKSLSATDRYYNKPMYKLVIECNTDINGAFLAKVAEVYVD